MTPQSNRHSSYKEYFLETPVKAGAHIQKNNMGLPQGCMFVSFLFLPDVRKVGTQKCYTLS